MTVSSCTRFLLMLFLYIIMEKKENKKNILDIKWDEKAIKSFEAFLKDMYGKNAKIKY